MEISCHAFNFPEEWLEGTLAATPKPFPLWYGLILFITTTASMQISGTKNCASPLTFLEDVFYLHCLVCQGRLSPRRDL